MLRGAGSLMDIIPTSDLLQFTQRRTIAERMSSHFVRVGGALSRACNTFSENEQTTLKNAQITLQKKRAP